MSAFWNFVTRFVPGNLAKAEEVNTNLDGVNTGFNLVEAEINKAIQVTDNPGVTDIGLNAAARANKLLSFDVNGDIAATTIIGDWKGDHADAAGTDYEIRDVVKDAAGSLGQDNIYICTNTHTSTGSLLIDTANWDLLVDVAGVAASAAAALVSENNAATSADFLDDRVLGSFSTAAEPTLDNDGNALLTGAQYFNTDLDRMKVYTGSVWQLNTAAAADVTIADAGAIYTATEVEAALQEVKLIADILNTAINSSADATAITIDSNENIGIGVTALESWSDGPALQLGNTGALWAFPNQINMINDAYYDGGWKYLSGAAPSYYFQAVGKHQFSVASSGTADDPIIWTLALSLTNTGDAVFGGNNSLADGKSLYLGSSDDFRLTHDGTDTTLSNETGVFYIIQRVHGGTLALATEDSGGVYRNGITLSGGAPSVKLHYNGTEQLTTASGGPVLSATPSSDDNSLKIATTAFVKTANAGLNTKVIDIGDWDMDGTDFVAINHGLTLSTIRQASVLIRNDADSAYYDFMSDDQTGSGEHRIAVDSAQVSIYRSLGGLFDGVGYNATSFNRGWITIQYTD